ncbi:uncharacterized protein METZ01_LOCUS390367, partial [marine metagenome]
MANEPGWFALNKFAGILGQTHPRYADRPNITSTIRSQAKAGKGQLQRLGITQCHYVFGPELEIPGPVVFDKERSTADLLNNAYGSDLVKFSYRFLSAGKSFETDLECNLPIAQHLEKPLALASHKSGK